MAPPPHERAGDPFSRDGDGDTPDLLTLAHAAHAGAHDSLIHVMGSLQALACSMAARDRLRCFYHGNLDDHFSKSLTNSRRQLQHARRPDGTWPRCFRLHDARPAPWLCVCVCASVCVCVFGCTTRGRLSIKTLCVYVCVSVCLSVSLSLSLSVCLSLCRSLSPPPSLSRSLDLSLYRNAR